MADLDQLAQRIEILRQTVAALIEVVGSHPDFNGPLSEALVCRGVDLTPPRPE